jgi:hypothetical protein
VIRKIAWPLEGGGKPEAFWRLGLRSENLPLLFSTRVEFIKERESLERKD